MIPTCFSLSVYNKWEGCRDNFVYKYLSVLRSFCTCFEVSRYLSVILHQKYMNLIFKYKLSARLVFCDYELVMDREAWRAAINGVTKSRMWLSDWTELNWGQDDCEPVKLVKLVKKMQQEEWIFFLKNDSLTHILCQSPATMTHPALASVIRIHYVTC